MAIGLALMLGFVFVKNFDSPYRAHSITHFWRRWHISLSTWLRDYLYFPLGGNRKGPVRTYVNLMLVMLIGGLWHGAAWTFVVWGALHGTLLCLERRFSRHLGALRIPGSIRTLTTFVILCLTWVFFRATSLQHAVQYCGAMAGLREAGPQADLLAGLMYQPYSLLTLLAAAAITWLSPQTWDFTKQMTATRAAFAMSLLWLSIVVLTVQSYNPFIYFMF